MFRSLHVSLASPRLLFCYLLVVTPALLLVSYPCVAESAIAHSHMVMFLDRTHDEGDEYLLYAYPTSCVTALRLLRMKSVFSVLDGAVSAVSGQQVQTAVFKNLSDEDGSIAPRISACSVELTGQVRSGTGWRTPNAAVSFSFIPSFVLSAGTFAHSCCHAVFWAGFRTVIRSGVLGRG